MGVDAVSLIAETLWPTRCGICDTPGKLLCDECARALPYIDATTACPRCGAAFGHVQCCECNSVMLASCGRDQLPFSRMASAVMLDDGTRRLVSAYKDGGERGLADIMATIMARYVAPEWVDGATITYIPATASAVRRRGFDHAELIAQGIADLLGRECRGLIERPHARDQRRLSRKERLANMRGPLGIVPGERMPSKVIVVDDVCTTGSTLYSAADEQREGGAHELYGLSFARA